MTNWTKDEMMQELDAMINDFGFDCEDIGVWWYPDEEYLAVVVNANQADVDEEDWLEEIRSFLDHECNECLADYWWFDGFDVVIDFTSEEEQIAAAALFADFME